MPLLTDHTAIREWALARSGKPVIDSPHGGEETIRLTFGQQSQTGGLQSDATNISTQAEWPDWFKLFDAKNLALQVEDEAEGLVTSNHSFIVREG